MLPAKAAKCILAYIFQRKMFSCAKMHLMQKCIFAQHHIFLWKMFSITFSFGKCSAVQKCCVFCFAKNKDAYILLVQKCCVFCKAKNKDAYILLVRCQNAFVTFCYTKCTHLCFLLCKKHSIFAKQNVTNAFDAKMHFGVYFPKENVQLCKNAFDAKMHFCNATRTFYFVKCSASHFPKENVQQNKMLQMHLMPKCI